MSRRSKQGKRWSIADKTLALSIFHRSRKVYCLLSKLFCLPSKSTLLTTLGKSNLSPGSTDKVFGALRLKVASMPHIDCQCAVTFEEMSLKSALAYNSHGDVIEGFDNFGELGQTKYMATHALVFMALGLSSKWKQPVGYFLRSGPNLPSLPVSQLFYLFFNTSTRLPVFFKFLPVLGILISQKKMCFYQ